MPGWCCLECETQQSITAWSKDTFPYIFREIFGPDYVCSVTYSTCVPMQDWYMTARSDTYVETKPSTSALGHVTHGTQYKLCFLHNGCFNDSKKLNLGHEIKQWDWAQQVSAIKSTSSTPCWNITWLFYCEMCLSPQVRQDQNRIPGVQHSSVFPCAFFEILLQCKGKKEKRLFL